MVLNHTRQGTFGDPYYGGNANFVGWDLIGYPGVRTTVSAADQQALERNQLKPNRRRPTTTRCSTRPPRRAEPGGPHHGD